MSVPINLLFTKEHEWAKIEGNIATVGITDHAQSALGDITFVELPGIGVECKQFKECATIESVKAASSIYAPLSGKVINVNEMLNRSPEIINQSPYDKGWLMVLEISNDKEKENLMSPSLYEQYLAGLAQ